MNLLETIKNLFQKYKNNYPIIFIFFLVISLLIYWPSLNIGFLSDDWGYAYLAEQTDYQDAAQFFYQVDLYGTGKGNFRPLTSFIAVILYKPLLNWPLGLHFVSIFLTVICSILVIVFTKKLLNSQTAALIAGFIFLTSPLNTENVSWLSASNGLLALIPLLGALIIYVKQKIKLTHIILILILLIISLTAKEYALLFILFVPLLDKFLNRNTNWSLILWLLILDTFYLIWRLFVLNGFGGYLTSTNQSLHFQFNFTQVFNYIKLPLVFFYNYFNSLNLPLIINFVSQLIPLFLILILIYSIYKKKTNYKPFLIIIILIYLGNLLGWNLFNPLNPVQAHSRIILISLLWYVIFMAYLFQQIKHPVVKSLFIIYLIILPILSIFQVQPWVKAGQVTHEINQSIKQNIQPSQKHFNVINLPDNYQGAFIYRNGLDYFLAMFTMQAKENIILNKKHQSELNLPVYLNDLKIDLSTIQSE